MGMLGPGRHLVASMIVTSPGVKATVSNAALADAIVFRARSQGIMFTGQPTRIPAPLVINTVESTFQLGWQRVETQVSMYLELSGSLDTLTLSNIVSQSWNEVSLANRNGAMLQLGGGVTRERPLGQYTCPPGSVFEEGGREDTLRWCSGRAGLAIGTLLSVLPIEENFYQVRTVHAPFTDTTPVPRVVAGGVINSLTTSAIRDSNIPAIIGQSEAEHSAPTMADITAAARAAGVAVRSTASEVIGAATGMGSSDIRFIAYASLGIVGALVFVKVLKEVKAI